MHKLINYISSIEDTRGGFNLKHKLIDIIVITILAIMNGVTTWDGIALFGKMREKWLREFLEWNPLFGVIALRSALNDYRFYSELTLRF